MPDRRDDVTVEEIKRLRLLGLTNKQVAEYLKCSVGLIHKRMNPGREPISYTAFVRASDGKKGADAKTSQQHTVHGLKYRLR